MNLQPPNIKNDDDDDDAESLTPRTDGTAQAWSQEFKQGRKNLEDDARSRQPSTTRNPKRVTKFTNWWLETKKWHWNLWNTNCIRQEIIYHILHKDLGKFIPHSLADEQKNKVITGGNLDETLLPTWNLYSRSVMGVAVGFWGKEKDINHFLDKRLVIHK